MTKLSIREEAQYFSNNIWQVEVDRKIKSKPINTNPNSNY